MKILILSDIHLTHKFDKNKFNFLFKLFNDCDRLIVNGDFWSCYSCTFDEFVNSEWKKLFPVMLKKQTLYIYGNHDRKEFMDRRVNLFSLEQCLRKEITIGKNTFHIEHGHFFFAYQSISNPKFMEINRKLKIDERIRYPLDKFLYTTVGVGKLFKMLWFMNKQIKTKGKKILQVKKILVTGHTHLPEHDQSLGFVNTGFVDQGLAWYLIIENHHYKLKHVIYA